MTSEGIIVIDPLFDYSVEDEVVGGLRSSAPIPTTIKYVIVSHGHSDHAGGASFLQDRYHARVIMSEDDWDLMDRTKASWRKPSAMSSPPTGKAHARRHHAHAAQDAGAHTGHALDGDSPARRGVATRGRLLGRHRVQLARQPRRLHHRRTRPDRFWFDHYIDSAQRFRRLAAEAGADVLLSNHTAFDGSKTKLPSMAKRRPGDPHPYVIGAPGVARYLTVAEECAQAGRARVP